MGRIGFFAQGFFCRSQTHDAKNDALLPLNLKFVESRLPMWVFPSELSWQVSVISAF